MFSAQDMKLHSAAVPSPKAPGCGTPFKDISDIADPFGLPSMGSSSIFIASSRSNNLLSWQGIRIGTHFNSGIPYKPVELFLPFYQVLVERLPSPP
jgi:hypothetical protein